MYESREQLKTLTEIRSLMERSSKFLSLSGLSGVSAGIIALVGAGAVYLRTQAGGWIPYDELQLPGIRQFLVTVALAVLGSALLAGSYFTIRKARRQGQRVWNASSKRMLSALLVPLAAGGVFCLALLHYNLVWLTFPTTLVFYGLALLNGSKYTYRDVESLAYCEIGLGCLALFSPDYSLLAWTIGFGGLHILYGLTMHFKYDHAPHEHRPAGSV